jgi:hypothetical protein
MLKKQTPKLKENFLQGGEKQTCTLSCMFESLIFSARRVSGDSITVAQQCNLSASLVSMVSLY